MDPAPYAKGPRGVLPMGKLWTLALGPEVLLALDPEVTHELVPAPLSFSPGGPGNH